MGRIVAAGARNVRESSLCGANAPLMRQIGANAQLLALAARARPRRQWRASHHASGEPPCSSPGRDRYCSLSSRGSTPSPARSCRARRCCSTPRCCGRCSPGSSALEQTAARAQRRAQLPDNVGQAWTTEEESKLVGEFKSGESADAIARKHGRTLRAIEARLEKLGLITAEERTTRGGFTGVSEAPPRPRMARGAILRRKRAQRRSR